MNKLNTFMLLIAALSVAIITNTANAADLKLVGNWRYKVNGNTVRITGERIQNDSESGKSGTVRMQIFLTNTVFSGNGKGHVFAECQFDQLTAGYGYSGIDQTLSISNPSAGYYYVSLVLEEYTNSGWKVKDYLNFDGTQYFGKPVQPQVCYYCGKSGCYGGCQTKCLYCGSSTCSGTCQIPCGYCSGTGKCYFCNSAGQSNACVNNMFGVSCKDPYCTHRCKQCGGSHICTSCKGTGKQRKY